MPSEGLVLTDTLVSSWRSYRGHTYVTNNYNKQTGICLIPIAICMLISFVLINIYYIFCVFVVQKISVSALSKRINRPLTGKGFVKSIKVCLVFIDHFRMFVYTWWPWWLLVSYWVFFIMHIISDFCIYVLPRIFKKHHGNL